MSASIIRDRHSVSPFYIDTLTLTEATHLEVVKDKPPLLKECC